MVRLNPKRLSGSESEALIAAKLSWLLRVLGGCLPNRVYLFGSASRGELTESSDLDFALVFETERQLAGAKQAFYGAPREDDWPLDVLFYTEGEFASRSWVGGVAFLILREGRLVFEKESSS